MLSNKRLPSPPGTMDNATIDSRYVVSPLEDFRYHATEQSAAVCNPEARSQGPNHSNEKSFHTISDHAIASESPSTSTRSIFKSREYWWPWEWLCECLAVGSLGSMVVVLMYFHGKPQAEWRQSYFTLNGLVAFLATLTKTGLIIPVSAAIGQRKWLRFLPNKKDERGARRLGDFEMFDEASRGSIGSTKLIFSLNTWYVSYTIALLSIC
jgi:hypothetical protein